jgi:hypothetical protein
MLSRRYTLFDLAKTAEATISTAKLATPVVIMMADYRNEVCAAGLIAGILNWTAEGKLNSHVQAP